MDVVIRIIEKAFAFPVGDHAQQELFGLELKSNNKYHTLANFICLVININSKSLLAKFVLCFEFKLLHRISDSNSP